MPSVDIIFDSGSSINNGGSLDNPYFTLYPALDNIVGLQVLWVNIPFTYYVTDDYSNTFRFKDADFDDFITLPPATYNGITIIDVLNNLFAQGRTGPGVYHSLGKRYRWFLNPDNGKLCVYLESGASGPFEIEIIPGQEDLGSTLGMLKGVNKSSAAPIDFYDDNYIQQPPKYFLQSARICQLTGPNQILIHSSLAGQSFGAVRSQTNTSNLICFVPVTSQYNGQIQNTIANPQTVSMTPTTISSVDFYLTLGNKTQYTVYQESLQQGSQQHPQARSGVQYLPLQGQSWQIAVRFLVKEDDSIERDIANTKKKQKQLFDYVQKNGFKSLID